MSGAATRASNIEANRGEMNGAGGRRSWRNSERRCAMLCRAALWDQRDLRVGG